MLYCVCICVCICVCVCVCVFAHLLLRPAAAECRPCSPVRCGPRRPPRWPLRPTGAGETHHICYTRQCLTRCNLFMDRPLTSHLSLTKYDITSTVSSGQPQTIVPIQQDIYPQVNWPEESQCAIVQHENPYIFHTLCTTRVFSYLHYGDVSVQNSEGEGCPVATIRMHRRVFWGAWRHLAAQDKAQRYTRYRGRTLQKTPQ